MANNIKRLLVTASIVALGVAAQTAPASATTGGDSCGTDASTGFYGCMYIGGGEIRGWAHQTNSGNLPSYPVHEEVTGPLGVVCNSATVTLTSTSQVVACGVYPVGTIASGTYCAITWGYIGGYFNAGEECLNVL